jgi:hypothetical protein
MKCWRIERKKWGARGPFLEFQGYVKELDAQTAADAVRVWMEKQPARQWIPSSDNYLALEVDVPLTHQGEP